MWNEKNLVFHTVTNTYFIYHKWKEHCKKKYNIGSENQIEQKDPKPSFPEFLILGAMQKDILWTFYASTLSLPRRTKNKKLAGAKTHHWKANIHTPKTNIDM